ncbi:hypothetical protein [Microbacterium sp. SORGH_AS_0888]|uniref:adenosine deaminase family protein n=1 Tax=Microbacterium sp. SORGH_AS_0888 TaxID=3041791 RepID=UPI002785B7FE|nr:hypothetical protein [Microbacterium sp. SORGH_AS_0888]MDQ1130855.1 adenosine deaminase [Microbacterium sp. SORGH_AS_0888]
MDEAVVAVHDGLDAGMRDVAGAGHRVTVRQVLSVMRTGVSDDAVVAAAERGAGAGVVGIDLAGHEEGHPAHAHAAAFARAARAGLRRTVHAGEAEGAVSIADALTTCAAERIGHGARLVEDIAVAGVRHGVREAVAAWQRQDRDAAALEPGEIATRVRDERIVLEVCPTSNSNGGVVDAIGQHPVSLLAAAGIRVSLHPDNRLLSETSVSREMRVVTDTFGWTATQLRRATFDALDAAFAPAELLDRIRVEQLVPGWD